MKVDHTDMLMLYRSQAFDVFADASEKAARIVAVTADRELTTDEKVTLHNLREVQEQAKRVARLCEVALRWITRGRQAAGGIH